MIKDDLVRRKDAVEKILNHKKILIDRYKVTNYNDRISGVKEGLQFAIGHLNELLPVECEWKESWDIDFRRKIVECSNCGQKLSWYAKENPNYCPNCGAKTKEKVEND